MAVTKQDLYDYILKSKYNFNGNIFGPMLDEYAAENGSSEIELPLGYEFALTNSLEDREKVWGGCRYLCLDQETGELTIADGIRDY